MEPNSVNYSEMYEGKMVKPIEVPGQPPEFYYDNTYWCNDIAYTISRTSKLELDKPTVVIKIPIDKLFDSNNVSPLLNQLKNSLLNSEVENEDDSTKLLKCTAADHILRAFNPYIKELNELNENSSRTDKKNGYYHTYLPNGKVLTRNSSCFGFVTQKYYKLLHHNVFTLPENKFYEKPPKMCVHIMIQVQLPYKNHKKAIRMLINDLPVAVENFILKFSTLRLVKALVLANQQASIRTWLKNSDYCAFIANGSILPRLKDTDMPLRATILFQSTASDEIEVCGVRGMGISRGVTVITGGGYSGKSTILDAISDGIYNHIGGDGRELVITDESAIKISAEDGRSVKNVNISPFIRWLPNGDIYNFSTEHASGSTSQAANIMEAVNADSKLILIDEDKSATNFMIRDSMMKKLIEKDPIIPFTERVNELYSSNGISTILVIGGSGEYLSVANKIYMMNDYLIYDVTNKAKCICQNNIIKNDELTKTSWKYKRVLLREGFTNYPDGSGTEKLEVSDMGFILIGDERIDIRMLHNIATQAQLSAIGFILRRLENSASGSEINIEELLDGIYETIAKKGLDSVFDNFFTNCGRFLDLPRKCEVLAIINRMRKIRFINSKLNI